MPSLNESGGYIFLLWCVIVMVACAFVVASPIKFFTVVSLRRRPLPKFIEKRWVLLAYRVSAAVIFVWVSMLLLELFRK